MHINLRKNFFISLFFFSLIFGLIFYRGPCFLTEGIIETNAFQFYNYLAIASFMYQLAIHPNNKM